jgi:hypothetical protein
MLSWEGIAWTRTGTYEIPGRIHVGPELSVGLNVDGASCMVRCELLPRSAAGSSSPATLQPGAPFPLAGATSAFALPLPLLLAGGARGRDLRAPPLATTTSLSLESTISSTSESSSITSTLRLPLPPLPPPTGALDLDVDDSPGLLLAESGLGPKES